MLVKILRQEFLFGSIKLTKIADSDKYKYFGYVIGFDVRESFSLLNGSRFEKYVIIIFGADLSLLVHINNNKKDILILGKGPTGGLNDTTLTTEKKMFDPFY